MESEIIVPVEINKTQNKQNLENIIKKVKIIKDELNKEMKGYGITPLVAEKIFKGEEIINCVSCGTPNMYKTLYMVEGHLSMYKFDKCNEIHY